MVTRGLFSIQEDRGRVMTTVGHKESRLPPLLTQVTLTWPKKQLYMCKSDQKGIYCKSKEKGAKYWATVCVDEKLGSSFVRRWSRLCLKFPMGWNQHARKNCRFQSFCERRQYAVCKLHSTQCVAMAEYAREARGRSQGDSILSCVFCDVPPPHWKEGKHNLNLLTLSSLVSIGKVPSKDLCIRPFFVLLVPLSLYTGSNIVLASQNTTDNSNSCLALTFICVHCMWQRRKNLPRSQQNMHHASHASWPWPFFHSWCNLPLLPILHLAFACTLHTMYLPCTFFTNRCRWAQNCDNLFKFFLHICNDWR